ncbi:MAG: HAD family hydrolase [Candidatus Hodarchaeales archaeon]|jgi:phosphoglycolate phosphatase
MASKADIAKIDTLIFDFDGTLHKGEIISLPIFQECLQSLYKDYKIPNEFPADEIILSQFGKQTEEIYPSLLKTTDQEIIETFGRCVEETEVNAFRSGKGELYPNVETTLETLKKRGYKIALCTNARVDYFNAVSERFQLRKFFDIMLAAGQFPGKDKSWMVQRIINILRTKHFAVIGDRFHDIEAAKKNNGISIGCSYGFGSEEVQKADIIISKLDELISIF